MITQLRQQQDVEEEEELRELQNALHHAKAEANELKVEMELRKLREDVEHKEWEEERMLEQQLLAGLKQGTPLSSKQNSIEKEDDLLDEFSRRRLAFFAIQIQAQWRGYRTRKLLKSGQLPRSADKSRGKRQKKGRKSNFKPKNRERFKMQPLNSEQRDSFLQYYKDIGNTEVDKSHIILKLEALNKQEDNIRRQLDISGDNNLLLHTLDRMQEEKDFYKTMRETLEIGENNGTVLTQTPTKFRDPFVDMDYQTTRKLKDDCDAIWTHEHNELDVAAKVSTVLATKPQQDQHRHRRSHGTEDFAVGGYGDASHNNSNPNSTANTEFRLPSISPIPADGRADMSTTNAVGTSPAASVGRPRASSTRTQNDSRASEQAHIKKEYQHTNKVGQQAGGHVDWILTKEHQHINELKKVVPKQKLHRHKAAPLLEMYGLKGSMFDPEQFGLSL